MSAYLYHTGSPNRRGPLKQRIFEELNLERCNKSEWREKDHVAAAKLNVPLISVQAQLDEAYAKKHKFVLEEFKNFFLEKFPHVAQKTAYLIQDLEETKLVYPITDYLSKQQFNSQFPAAFNIKEHLEQLAETMPVFYNQFVPSEIADHWNVHSVLPVDTTLNAVLASKSVAAISTASVAAYKTAAAAAAPFHHYQQPAPSFMLPSTITNIDGQLLRAYLESQERLTKTFLELVKAKEKQIEN